jgi:hypothetical protein
MDTADSKTITVNADGTYTPSVIQINNGGEAKFDVTYPAGMNVCNIPIGPITFSASEDDNTGGTVKVGS